jgi:alpha-beta hydrolase superfamily lysophospholipase
MLARMGSVSLRQADNTAMLRVMTSDILGAAYAARTLALRSDAEGEVVATLVRRVGAPPSRRAVLYVHGFVDYFFQTHLADFWIAEGYDFYAVDLRKYGRSLRPHQTPNGCLSLEEYDEELDLAARIIRDEDGHDFLIVMGHSTGGLITSLWANRRCGQGVVDALVLNSPWFDLNASLRQRTVGTAVIDVLGALRPNLVVGRLHRSYGEYLHVSTGGAWDYELAWKPIDGFPVLAGWLRAIRRGHAQLARGLAIDVPILVACSTRSGPTNSAPDVQFHADCVLNVDHIARRSVLLGAMVTLARIEGGIHDLSLSPAPARAHFFNEVRRWAATYVPSGAVR